MRWRRFSAVQVQPGCHEMFFAAAPFVSRIEVSFDAPVQAVWDVIVGDRMWSWLPTVWGCRYPVGEVAAPSVVRDFRQNVLGWLIYAQHEKVITLEPCSQMVYTATDATLPFFGTWCERYAVTSVDAGNRTIVNWTLAVRPRYVGSIPAAWLSTLLRPILTFGLRRLASELPVRNSSQVITPR